MNVTVKIKTLVDNVHPLYGPVAGGTRVTIAGQFLYRFRVKAVYFGHHQGIIDNRFVTSTLNNL